MLLAEGPVVWGGRSARHQRDCSLEVFRHHSARHEKREPKQTHVDHTSSRLTGGRAAILAIEKSASALSAISAPAAIVPCTSTDGEPVCVRTVSQLNPRQCVAIGLEKRHLALQKRKGLLNLSA
jgi:hypothetical protein